MPITIETSPALVTGSSSPVTTASFTPPSGSLLVAAVVAESGTGPVVSGGSLTWTRRVQSASGGCELWTAPVVTGASMTVSVAIADTGVGMAAALKVDVLSGQDSSPIGNTGTGTDPTDNATVTGYTSTGESRGFGVARDSNDGGQPSSTDTASAFHLAAGAFITLDGMAVRKAADTPDSGQSVTFNLDSAGTSDASWQWAALEILALPTPVKPHIVIPVGAVHRAGSW